MKVYPVVLLAAAVMVGALLIARPAPAPADLEPDDLEPDAGAGLEPAPGEIAGALAGVFDTLRRRVASR